jgi:hypothetical protein
MNTLLHSAVLMVAISLVVPARAEDQPSGKTGFLKNEGTTQPVATGKVVDPNSKPATGVPMQVVGPKGKTFAFTDENGYWSLYNLAPGTYQVKPGWASTDTQQTINFTVQQPTLLEGLFGAKDNKTFYATEMKLDKSFK